MEFCRINSASFERTIKGFCAVDGQALPAEQQEKAPSFIQDGDRPVLRTELCKKNWWKN